MRTSCLNPMNERMTELICVLSWKIFSWNYTFTRTYFISLLTFENDRHFKYFKTGSLFSRLIFLSFSFAHWFLWFISYQIHSTPEICKLLKLHLFAVQCYLIYWSILKLSSSWVNFSFVTMQNGFSIDDRVHIISNIRYGAYWVYTLIAAKKIDC